MTDIIKTARYWRALAIAEFGPSAEITSWGRFAVVLRGPKGNPVVYLFTEKEKAHSVALGWESCRIVDLYPLPVIADDFEDVQRERREAKRAT